MECYHLWRSGFSAACSAWERSLATNRICNNPIIHQLRGYATTSINHAHREKALICWQSTKNLWITASEILIAIDSLLGKTEKKVAIVGDDERVIQYICYFLLDENIIVFEKESKNTSSFHCCYLFLKTYFSCKGCHFMTEYNSFSETGLLSQPQLFLTIPIWKLFLIQI